MDFVCFHLTTFSFFFRKFETKNEAERWKNRFYPKATRSKTLITRKSSRKPEKEEESPPSLSPLSPRRVMRHVHSASKAKKVEENDGDDDGDDDDFFEVPEFEVSKNFLLVGFLIFCGFRERAWRFTTEKHSKCLLGERER